MRDLRTFVTDAHPLRAPHLRRRRQRRGGAPRGIQVNRVRIAVFALASTLAAAGGILAASRLLAVNQSSGGSDLLLLAIAGPVIAGTSLFGGRGSVWSALLGALVIGSISNGMDLLALESVGQVHDHRRGAAARRHVDAVLKAQRERAGASR